MINNRQGGRRRGRGGGGGGPPRSNNPGPGNRQDNRQRGNAAQLLEKYKGLARDAQMQGDRVQTEYYHQYADHYFRVLNESRVRYEEQRRPRDDYEDEGEEAEAEAGAEAEDAGQDAGDDQEQREEAAREAARREDYREERPERPERPDRSQGNGEYRARRGRGRPAEEAGDDRDEERISLDVLPPAIAPASEPEADEAPPRPARARRARRPRGEDEDIAPAA